MQPGTESERPDLRPSAAPGLSEDRKRFLHLPDSSRLIDADEVAVPRGRSAAFLDRDGVVLDEDGYLLHANDLTMMPGAVEAISTLSQSFLVVFVTNQSAVARGLLDQDGLAHVHSRLVQNITESGGIVDAIYYCPHLPDGEVDAFSFVCECRKPEPGMILSAAADWEIDLSNSFLVGDQQRDIQAGAAAGVTGYRVGPEGDYSDLATVTRHVLT